MNSLPNTREEAVRWALRSPGLKLTAGCIFYACSASEEGTWEKNLEDNDDELLDFPPTSIGIDGHMATEVKVERAEVDLANRIHKEFKAYQPDITASRLTKYWASFRNYMELALVPRHKGKVDQRVFDAFVFCAVNTSFGNFAELVVKMPAWKGERAAIMMYKQGQGFAKSLALQLNVEVLWHHPGQFIEPIECQKYANPAYAAPLVPGYVPKGYQMPVAPNGYQMHPYGSFTSFSQKGQKFHGKGAGKGKKGAAKGGACSWVPTSAYGSPGSFTPKPHGWA